MADKSYKVYHERGGFIQVWAADEVGARERYYEALESTIGYTLKICGCFNNGVPKPIDRDKVLHIVKIEEDK